MVRRNVRFSERAGEPGGTGTARRLSGGRGRRGPARPAPIKMLPIIVALLLALTGCGSRAESGGESQEAQRADAEETASGQEKATAGNTSERRSGQEADSDDSAVRVMVGPQTPPEGERYDEWKGFTYTDETVFDVKSFYSIVTTDGKPAEEYGFVYSPVIDGTLEITDAGAEPVGGEMKLRSGGYVDVTVETRWKGVIEFRYSGNANVFLEKKVFTNVSAEPCDAYTGTAFLNDVSDEENEEAQEINVGEATANSLIESDVTWKRHTYRIYVGDDLKNSSFDMPETDFGEKYTTEKDTVSTIETFTFRVPADYDGLVLCIPKDVTGQMDARLNERGDFIDADDRYADVLTDFTGQKHDADDYYFVRVSDLLEKFDAEDK